MAVGDSGLLGGRFDVGGQRLAVVLAVGPVVDDHGDAMTSELGYFLRGNLACDQGLVVKRADHRQVPPAS
jgi:hypothetical protein